MFGSLRKKLEEVSAQVNMFDGGKTAATVRANRNQAPPAQTIRSQPKQNSLVGRNDNQPGFQITNNSFTRGLSRGFDQANMFDNNRTWQQRTPTGTQSIGQEAKRIVNTPTTPKKYWDNGVGKAVNTAIAGTNRAAAGIGQDLGGLVDYVTPGKGTNRVTSYFRDRGAMWDDKAKEAGVDGLGYKVSQVPLNVASYMVPGSVAKGVGSIPRVASTGAKVANIASKTPGVSSVLSAGAKLSTKLDDIAKTGNIAQRTGARLASSYMSKPAMADVAFDTIQSAGSRTSKGQDNSFGTLAVDTGLSLATQGGVNLAGQALKPVTTRLVQTAKNLPSPAQVTTRLAGASRKIDETLFTPRLNRLDLDTRDALIAYSDRLVGADPYITGKVESDLIKKVRAIGDANGVDLTNGTVVQQLDRIEALLNGYKGSSGALNSKPVPVDPLESLKQEARKYKSAEEFVSKNRLAAEARITELQKQIDDGERSVDSLMRKTRKAPNAEEAIKFESQAQVIRKQLRPLKEEQFGLKDALDSRYGEDSIYIQTPAEREAFLKSTGHFKARELKTAVKKYTDLYDQAHSQPTPTPQAPKPEALDPTAAPVQKVAKADHWTTPLPDDGKRPPITAKDTNGIIPQEGDVIEFPGLLGKKGRTTVHWQGPVRANASGKEIPGQWIGNGVLREDSPIPFTVVERNGKPLAPKVEVPTGFSKSLEDAGLAPDEEIAAIHRRANSSRNGKLTLSEEKRIAELSGAKSEVPKPKSNELTKTPSKITTSTNDGKDLAEFLSKSHDNLPEGQYVTITYQPSGTMDPVTISGKVKSSYGGKVRNDVNTMTYKGKKTDFNNYSAEGRTFITDNNGNVHKINNGDINSIELDDKTLIDGLTAMEKEIARMSGISEIDFAKNKQATTPKPTPTVEKKPTQFEKNLQDAGFSTPQSRVGRNKVQAGSQARTPNQLKSANKGQSFESSESLASYPEGKPKKAQPETVEAKQSPKQSDLSSSRSSDNIIDLESIDVNDPFGNRSLTQKVKNEFNRMFIDEDAEMISLLRKVEKETGSKDMVEKWLQDTDMVRGSNSIANSKIRSNENLKGAIHGLSKKEVKQLDEYASARSELYNLENGLSASKSKEKLQSIINKHEAKYGKRFESLNNYYNDLAKDLHEAGIISKEQMDTWAKNKDYVRVQRDMEDLLEPSVGKSRSRSFGSTSTSKKRTGSKRDILSPTETAFKRTQEIQLEIQRNKAASNIIDVLEKHGLSERIPQSQAHGKNVIKRFKDGKVEYFATNKDIKRVIENVRPFELGVIAKVVSFPTRVFKAGTTGLSAPFAVTNYARDQVGSAIYSKSVMATHNPKNIASGIYQGVKDFGGVGNSEIWEKFVKHAGDQTSFDMTRGTLGSKSIMNEVRRGSLKQRGITLVDPRYLVRNVEDLISITEKSTRYQNFKGIYEKAIKEGLGEDVAIQKATQAALQNSVNFGRAGSVAKAANLILPYFNAGIQGSRNLGRSFRDRPVATAAKSVGFVGIPMVALTLHNYSDPETREIYSNIDETEKQDNFIIVLPGAKQRDDGTYEGILKIPKPQGYRELLDPLRSYAESFASGEDPKDVASMLKDMLPAISGPIQTEDTGKLISSLTPQALKPALQAHLNKDLYWGNDVVPDYMIAGTDDPTERARKNTSGMARFIANRLNVSPIAVEKFIIDSTGSLGRYGINAIDSELARRDIIPDEQIGGRSISSDFKRRTTEARGIENKNMTDGQRYFRDREEVTKSLKPQQKTAWESYNQSNKNFKGEVVFDKSSFAQKQAKASAYVQFPELFETDKKLDKKARDRGEPGNPLYDLNYKQAIKVVLKKALPPGSKDSELDALYNQPWYADFKAKESQYYDKIFAGKEKEDSGYPQRSPELQKKIDYYYTLPKGTGQRSDFLKSNPDVIQHWDAVEAWTNGERAKIGLDPTTKDDSFGFGSGGGRGVRRGRSKAGYDYTKALFDANVGSVSMTKDLQSILEKYMKANAKISKKA